MHESIKHELEAINQRLGRIERFLALIVKGEFNIMAKLDDLTKQLDDETNAISAKIDALNLKVGDTVTQAQLDALQAVSDRLKSLGSDPAQPIPPPVPAPAPTA